MAISLRLLPKVTTVDNVAWSHENNDSHTNMGEEVDEILFEKNGSGNTSMYLN